MWWSRVVSAVSSLVLVGAIITLAPAAHAAPCGDGSLAFSGGDGSAGSPFLISTQADLVALRDGYTTTPSYYSCAYRQTQNITLTGTWEHGIGFSTPGSALYKPFNGTYDGDGYSLTNLTINASAVATANQGRELGFIGLSTSANFSLRNLDLVNATITCGSQASYAALLVSQTVGSIERSSATGTVNCTAANALAFAGGLIGYNNGSVTNAWVSGTVTIPAAAPFSPNSVGGGIGSTDAGGSVQNLLIRVTVINPTAAIRTGVAFGVRDGSTNASYAEDGLTGGGTPLVGAGTTTGITLKSADQLKDISTYSGWSISAGQNTSTIWGIDPAINGGFPFLQPLPRSAGEEGPPPPPIVQQLPRRADGTCSIANDEEFGYGTTVTGGWNPSWAWWPNGGLGGLICTRTLVFVGRGWTVSA